MSDELPPNADVRFTLSEDDFINLYNGTKKTAVKFIFQGRMKLAGNYPQALKFYQSFLKKYVKDPKNNE